MKIKKIIKYFGIIVFLIFMFSYFLCYSGYYEYNLQRKRDLTSEQIKRFESDVKKGNDIDLNGYLTEGIVDYSNSLTRTTSEANIKLNDYLKRILVGGFDILGKFIK